MLTGNERSTPETEDGSSVAGKTHVRSTLLGRERERKSVLDLPVLIEENNVMQEVLPGKRRGGAGKLELLVGAGKQRPALLYRDGERERSAGLSPGRERRGVSPENGEEQMAAALGFGRW